MNQIDRPDKPVRVAFLAAGFNFARGRRILDVPYDPHTPFLFDGEETSLAIRAWTKGYNFYQPDLDIVSHLYIPSRSPLRPTFWQQKWGKRAPIQFRSMLRINYMMGLHDLYDKDKTQPIDLEELDKYGLGTARTAQQYWDWAGVTPELTDADGNPTEEWSTSRCKVYQAGGMPLVPVAGGASGAR